MNITLEKHFEKELQLAATAEGCHVVPIPDNCKVAYAQGYLGGSKDKEKPYDFGLCVDGHYVAIECKMAKGPTFDGKDLKEHQFLGLKTAGQAGALPILAIYFKWKARGKVTEVGFLLDYTNVCEYNGYRYDSEYPLPILSLASILDMAIDPHCSTVFSCGNAEKGFTVQGIRDMLRARDERKRER